MSGAGTDYTLTPSLGLYKPKANMAVGFWGDLWNSNADAIDAAIHFASGGGPFLPLAGGKVTGDVHVTGKLCQGYAATPPTWANTGNVNIGIGWYELIAEAQFYTTTGGIAVAAVGRASDYHSGSETPQVYAFAGYGVADIAPGTAEGMYLEGHKAVAGATAICLEMDTVNTGGVVPTINPYQTLNTGANVGIVIASGGGTGRPGPFYSASAALIIDRNNSDFLNGIVFGATGIHGNDGVTGTSVAVMLAKGHEIQWTHDNTGTRSAFIRSDATASSAGIEFNNSGFNIVDGATEAVYLEVNSSYTSVAGTLFVPTIQFNNGPAVPPAASGPDIRAGTGAAAGIAPKGSLWLRSDGAVGSTLYVSQGAGVWNAVAGV